MHYSCCGYIPIQHQLFPKNYMPIVTGASAYTNEAGMTYILIVHGALFYGDKLDHSLLNPNQIRANQVDYWDNPYDRSKPLSIDAVDTL